MTDPLSFDPPKRAAVYSTNWMRIASDEDVRRQRGGRIFITRARFRTAIEWAPTGVTTP
jgi:hypothetical protein